MVKIAVLGSGLLGTKIAGEFAYHGHRVKIYSSHLESLNTVFQRMEEDKQQLRQDGILLNRNFIGQVLCMSRLEETVSDADFVFECIPEDLEMKKDLFERVSHLCRPDTLIATNTLRLNVTDIADRTLNKERTLGLRFLYPVYCIPEVEITPNKYTSGQVIEKVRSILEKMGKTLFFRSGSEPLILTEDQRDERKKARREDMKLNSGMGTSYVHGIPNLRQTIADSATAHHVSDNRVSTDSEMDCAICMDKPRDCVMRPCHHMVTCYMCAAMLINRRDGCPICRKDITEIIRVYSG
ncbi:3-hydroxybutyryl-CoA dehydrogenase-like [Mercenaria mercenaria]|uniref:3-hydroxybutyryl-CoA dehydrogenase-like n=1 Tax=Mercenaria mercenaria TaxID=6596 RepID=UPI00234FB5D6|nr:3-hydroxybutyryl-CoA dehydrogenase-like [Mercenaria mercenaria]